MSERVDRIISDMAAAAASAPKDFDINAVLEKQAEFMLKTAMDVKKAEREGLPRAFAAAALANLVGNMVGTSDREGFTSEQILGELAKTMRAGYDFAKDVKDAVDRIKRQ